MALLFWVLLGFYMLSILLIGVAYAQKNIDISVWAMLVMILPIVNTIVLIYLAAPKLSLKGFLNELKEKSK